MRITVFLALVTLAGCRQIIRVPDADLAIVNVTVIDGNGGEPVPGRTVLIANGRIAAVGAAVRTELPDAARRLDGSGRFLVPGLWDMHVHAWNPDPFAEIYLRNGITGIREMGTGVGPQYGGSAGVWDWREAVRDGRMPGPRVYAAGYILNGGDPARQGAAFFKGVETAEEGRRWVDSLADLHADFIKVYSALSAPTYEAIATRAAERGLSLAGHVPALVGTRAAVTNGMRSLEHLYGVLVATSSEELAIESELRAEVRDAEIPTAAAQLGEIARSDRLIASYDPAKADALFALLRDQGTWVDPTLVVSADPRCPNIPLPVLDSAELVGVPGFLRPFVQLRDLTAEDLGRRCRRFGKLSALVGELERAGVPLLAGSDGPNPGVRPGIGLHDELYLLVEAGLTPMRALQIATRDAAAFVGLADSLGTVEAGKIADLVLLDADPLSNIRNTRRIGAVVVGGEVVVGGS